jgi:hypothetical protein
MKIRRILIRLERYLGASLEEEQGGLKNQPALTLKMWQCSGNYLL